jgi:hypothetical protein
MSENTPTPPIGALQRIGETASARLLWIVAKVLVTTTVTGSIALATGYVREMRDDIKVASQRTQDLTLTQHDTTAKVDNLQKVSDASVLALQSIDRRVTQNEFDLGYLKQAATQEVQKSRPAQ